MHVSMGQYMKQEKEAIANNDDNEEELQKADFARVKERADLRHKTVSKKLRFYDSTNSKESNVRKTQNLESQRLKAKRPLEDSSEDDDDNIDVVSLPREFHVEMN